MKLFYITTLFLSLALPLSAFDYANEKAMYEAMDEAMDNKDTTALLHEAINLFNYLRNSGSYTFKYPLDIQSWEKKLTLAVLFGDKKAVSTILENKLASVHGFDWFPTMFILTRSFWVTGNNPSAMLDILLDYGADINIQYSHKGVIGKDSLTFVGTTPLSLVIITNSEEEHEKIEGNRANYAKIFLERGADPNIADTLIRSVSRKQFSSTEILLHYGADPNIFASEQVTEVGITPLVAAIKADASTQMLKLLLENGADINQLTKEKQLQQSPLIEAIAQSNIDLVEYLIQQEDIDLDQRNSKGRTATFEAALQMNSEILEILLKAGASTDVLFQGKKLAVFMEAMIDQVEDIDPFVLKKMNENIRLLNSYSTESSS